jgi:hypothetical protein
MFMASAAECMGMISMTVQVCGRLKVEIKRVQFPDKRSLFQPIETPQREPTAEEKSNWAIQVGVDNKTNL